MYGVTTIRATERPALHAEKKCEQCQAARCVCVPKFMCMCACKGINPDVLS